MIEPRSHRHSFNLFFNSNFLVPHQKTFSSFTFPYLVTDILGDLNLVLYFRFAVEGRQRRSITHKRRYGEMTDSWLWYPVPFQCCRFAFCLSSLLQLGVRLIGQQLPLIPLLILLLYVHLTSLHGYLKEMVRGPCFKATPWLISTGTALNSVWPSFWTRGSVSAFWIPQWHPSIKRFQLAGWSGFVKVDGTAYNFLGAPHIGGETPLKAIQKSSEVGISMNARNELTNIEVPDLGSSRLLRVFLSCLLVLSMSKCHFWAQSRCGGSYGELWTLSTLTI